MNNNILKNLKREDSLDVIQKYVLENASSKEVSNEMFKLFFNVIELGKELRISKNEKNIKNSESKIIDIFLTLISICNNLNINLFDALKEENSI